MILSMETPAEYFTRAKSQQQQALKMLGHQVSPPLRKFGNSTGSSTRMIGRPKGTGSISRPRSKAR